MTPAWQVLRLPVRLPLDVAGDLSLDNLGRRAYTAMSPPTRLVTEVEPAGGATLYVVGSAMPRMCVWHPCAWCVCGHRGIASPNADHPAVAARRGAIVTPRRGFLQMRIAVYSEASVRIDSCRVNAVCPTLAFATLRQAASCPYLDLAGAPASRVRGTPAQYAPPRGRLRRTRSATRLPMHPHRVG